MAYTPLTMPAMPNDADFSDTANWLAEATTNIAESGDSYIQALTDLVDVDFSTVGDLPNFSSLVWLGDTVGVLDRPTRPTVDTDIQVLLDRLTQLTAPSAPSASFSYAEPGYASDLRNPLIAKLLDNLVNGGYGIENNDETALFNRERDREVAIYQAAQDELRRQQASTSFPLPQGSMQHALDKARQDYNAKLSSVGRDIALRRSELYVQNRQFTIEKVLASEEQSIALYNAIQDRQLRAAQTEVQMAIALFEAGVRVFMAQAEVLKTQVEAQMDAARAQVQVYASEVASYAAFVNAVVSAAQVDIANSKNVLTRDIASHQARVDIVRFKLQKLVTTVDNAKDIRKFGVEFFRTALGSAMNGVNGLAVRTEEG